MLAFAFTLVKRVFSSKYYYKTAKWEFLTQIEQDNVCFVWFPHHFLRLTKYYKTFKNSRLFQYGDFIQQDGDFIPQEDRGHGVQDPQGEKSQDNAQEHKGGKVQERLLL